MILLAFPCEAHIAKLFCKKLDVRNACAVILKKQKGALEEMLLSAGVKKVYVLDENFYGEISSEETVNMLSEIRNMEEVQSFFPINDFGGNAALLLFAVTDRVTAVNATSDSPVMIDLHNLSLSYALPDNAVRLKDIQKEIVQRFENCAPQLQRLFSGNGAGERPTTGLVSNAPYDCEVLSRYVHAAKEMRGDVLEIGCGLGYGAYTIAELALETNIMAMDYDSGSIEAAEVLWSDNQRIHYKIGSAEKLEFKDNYFDSVVCFEVVEHVDDPASLFKEVWRVLKKGGKFTGSTPNYRLYPFRVNTEKVSPEKSEELRESGVWPWHIQKFDEDSIERLMEESGFKCGRFKYPTFFKGISFLESMSTMDTGSRLDFLSNNLDWSVADFGVLDEYYPVFSGFSFIFEAYK